MTTDQFPEPAPMTDHLEDVQAQLKVHETKLDHFDAWTTGFEKNVNQQFNSLRLEQQAGEDRLLSKFEELGKETREAISKISDRGRITLGQIVAVIGTMIALIGVAGTVHQLSISPLHKAIESWEKKEEVALEHFERLTRLETKVEMLQDQNKKGQTP